VIARAAVAGTYRSVGAECGEPALVLA
jgi:hypothetical protein